MSAKAIIPALSLLLALLFPALVPGLELPAPRERAAIQDRLLQARLDNLLPKLMAEAGLDCWLVICREYNEDPVFLSLMPAGTLTARRLSMLAFFLKGERVERISISGYDIGAFYRGAWKKGEEAQWAALARLIAEHDPRRIGVNRSRHYAHADGLSAFLEKELHSALAPELSARIVDAEKLAVRWLETRLPEEEEAFRLAVAFTRKLIARAFSREVIEPGLTSVEDLRWWMKSEMDRVGVRPWFFPHVDRKGRRDEAVANEGVIQFGDFLHCDVGIEYLGLCSDVQELGYVLAPGETEPPVELLAGLAAANRFLVHLEKAVIAILVFIGLKMLIGVTGIIHVPPTLSLIIVLGLLVAGVVGSWLFPGEKES